MNQQKESLQQHDSELASLLSRERPELQQFYKELSLPGSVLSYEFMMDHGPEEWRSFVPVVSGGETVAFARPGLTLTASEYPWIIMPDGASSSGKSFFTKELIKKCGDCSTLIKTYTTRPFRDDEKKASPFSYLPFVTPKESDQYIHMSVKEFDELVDNDFFVEHRPMWETGKLKRGYLYGIPRSAIEQARNGTVPFSFLVVDEKGQDAVIDWLEQNGSNHLNTQKWFLLPTEMPFSVLEDRIRNTRPDAASRIIDGLKDIYWGATRTDLMILNPFDGSGVPRVAIRNGRAVMKILRPDASL